MSDERPVVSHPAAKMLSRGNGHDLSVCTGVHGGAPVCMELRGRTVRLAYSGERSKVVGILSR